MNILARRMSCRFAAPLATRMQPVAWRALSASTSTTRRAYEWVPVEAEGLIAKAYNRHRPLLFGDKDYGQPAPVTTSELEKLGTQLHYPPKDFVDRVALGIMRVLRRFTHMFFRERYGHHAVVLETVAAVPGIVGAFHRHLRSLRGMKRDRGWINPLQEEAENERMHLLIWMYVTQPTRIERFLVLTAQFGYLVCYSALYAVSGRAAHRLVGYLEEEAQLAYTAYLEAVDAGKFENEIAPSFAQRYYRLPETARLRDIILHVRADECMHGSFNHHLADKYKQGDIDTEPTFLQSDMRDEKIAA
ncbi:unnamed protein product (mitochondrion) [Plasmodiophora brassicae]|uniref:Alternative oxidase n=1 Tax=Plasmodiophora brassicae TaxID=37360 RepID=A0A0G4IYY6_PLABS|nr:hypothetical protein PBRA_007970 [Plasmodiophora brassicae]SPQ96502.1 unnamed protein product [Plasmodiophora brassicae]